MSKSFTKLPVAAAIVLLLTMSGCVGDPQMVRLIQKFDPFCEYKAPVRERVSISYRGKVLTDEVVFQETYPRRWTGGMNTDGCRSKRGTSFVFVGDGNALILLPRQRTVGFIIDDAERPKTWRRFYPEEKASPVKVVRIETFATNQLSRDSLDHAGEAILQSDFDPPDGRFYRGADPTPFDFIDYRRQVKARKIYHPNQDPIILEPGAE